MTPGDRSVAAGRAPWPPLIPASRAPRWMRVRDALLTLLAWLFFAWVMRNALLVVLELVEPGLGAAAVDWFNTHLAAWFGRIGVPSPQRFWHDFRGYAFTVALFVLWICAFAFVNRGYLRRGAPVAGMPLGAQFVPPEPLRDHTRSADVEMTAAWRALPPGTRRLRLGFDASGAVREVVADPP